MALVSAVRETSVVFAALIATVLLKEGKARHRILAAVAVVFGALGLVVLYLDPVSTLVLTGAVGVVVFGLLIWLAAVPMEN